MRSITIPLAFMLAACLAPRTEPTGYEPTEQMDGAIDGTFMDGGEGGSPDDGDAGEGGAPSCTSDEDCENDPSASRCDEAAGSCARCETSADCAVLPDTPVCDGTKGCVECSGAEPGACAAAGKVCVEGGSTCAGCNADADCPDAAQAKCDLVAHECTSCDANSQCEHVLMGADDDFDVCSAGTCVQCTPSTEARHCGAGACDPETFTCTGTARGTLSAANHKCVKVPFGAADTGYRCMRQFPGCANPYRSDPISAVSRNGLPTAQYCAHNTGVTTCDAILSLTADKSCTEATAEADCGEGGRCATVTGALNHCTYSCASDGVCPLDYPCNEQNGAELNPYCGGPSI
jgi:hypothetical protein